MVASEPLLLSGNTPRHCLHGGHQLCWNLSACCHILHAHQRTDAQSNKGHMDQLVGQVPSVSDAPGLQHSAKL